MKNEITLEDGRTFSYNSIKGEKTILPTGQRVHYYDMGVAWYLGKDWEFTGRTKYESNPDWDKTLCYVEVIYIWEGNHGLIPFKKVMKSSLEWVNFDRFEYEYSTTTTIVECD